MTAHTVSHRGHEFRVLEGAVHPAYSIACFEADEKPFREQHWNVGPGDVVIDVGASYGAYALAACAAGATVCAFEPEPTVFIDLVQNVLLNRWESRCLAVCSGLWDKPGSVSMKTYAPHWPQQTISCDYAMTTLDEYVHRAGLMRLDWFKLDVEGAEVEALRGGLVTLKNFKPRCIIEAHTFLDATLADRVEELLRSVGYTQFERYSRPPCVMVVAS